MLLKFVQKNVFDDDIFTWLDILQEHTDIFLSFSAAKGHIQSTMLEYRSFQINQDIFQSLSLCVINNHSNWTGNWFRCKGISSPSDRLSFSLDIITISYLKSSEIVVHFFHNHARSLEDLSFSLELSVILFVIPGYMVAVLIVQPNQGIQSEN